MECCICFEKSNYTCKTGCNHFICSVCLTKMHSTLCPMCRRDLKEEMPDELIKIIKKNLGWFFPTDGGQPRRQYLDIRDQDQFPPLR